MNLVIVCRHVSFEIKRFQGVLEMIITVDEEAPGRYEDEVLQRRLIARNEDIVRNCIKTYVNRFEFGFLQSPAPDIEIRDEEGKLFWKGYGNENFRTTLEDYLPLVRGLQTNKGGAVLTLNYESNEDEDEE